jgi:hypothetical protein
VVVISLSVLPCNIFTTLEFREDDKRGQTQLRENDEYVAWTDVEATDPRHIYG